MEIEFQDEDLTVYIEDLKSDDPNLKINAVTRISNICDVLGEERTREELIPYLVDIIEECDNEDEFLIKLSDQILELKDRIGGKQYFSVLISPLESLCSIEEVTIRERAMKNLIKISEICESVEFYQNNLLETFKKLASTENYPSKISASTLMPHIYKKLDESNRKDILETFINLSKEDTPMVRRGVAASLSLLMSQMNRNEIKTNIVPLLKEFFNDSIDSVRVCALESLPVLYQTLEGEPILNEIIDFIQEKELVKKGWRFSFPFYSDRNNQKSIISPLFECLLTDTEVEVKCMALLNVHFFEDIIDSTIFNSSMLPNIKLASADPSSHVRCSTAQILESVARIYINSDGEQNGLELLKTNILPILLKLVTDENLDVKKAAMKEISKLNPLLNNEVRSQYIFPLMENFANEKYWRNRLVIAEYLSLLSKSLDWESFVENSEIIIDKYLLDHYAAVRIAIIPLLVSIYQDFPGSNSKEFVKNKINILLTSSNYLFRITGLQALVKFYNETDKNYACSMLEENYQSISNDKVSNVIFNLLKLAKVVKSTIKPNLKSKISQDAKKWENDLDGDISFFAKEFLA